MTRLYKSLCCVALLFSFSTFADFDATTNIDFIEELFDINQIIDNTVEPVMLQTHYTGEKYLYLVYVAADNDLRGFAGRNIKQMAKIGSNEHVTILVHLDIRTSGNTKVTRRYIVEHNNIVCMNQHDPATQRMNSGDPNTLIDFCAWGIQNFAHDRVALVLWDHGTGYLNPVRGRMINSSELFMFNPATNMVELDRSVGYLDFIEHQDIDSLRGICWDDSNRQYLNNRKLRHALSTVCKDYLGGNKFDLIVFDACLMSMLEIAYLVAPYADIQVSSQEVELGPGHDYERALSIFRYGAPTPERLAQHLVESFRQAYTNLTPDFTQSALRLATVHELSNNVSLIGLLLTQALELQRSNTVRRTIIQCRSRRMCTCFDEPTYIDLGHFYQNLLEHLHQFKLTDTNIEEGIKHELTEVLQRGIGLINDIVISKCTGNNVRKAHGISIYFPTSYLHSSYKNDLPFEIDNKWSTFLQQFLRG